MAENWTPSWFKSRRRCLASLPTVLRSLIIRLSVEKGGEGLPMPVGFRRFWTSKSWGEISEKLISASIFKVRERISGVNSGRLILVNLSTNLAIFSVRIEKPAAWGWPPQLSINLSIFLKTSMILKPGIDRAEALEKILPWEITTAG